MPHRLHQLLLALLLSLLPAGLQAATLYVSPQGSDSNPGTASAPFRTIGRGIQTMVSGDTLVLANGTYAEGNLAPPSHTTIKAAPGARPVLQPNNGSIDTIVYYAPGVHHVTLDGLVLDAGSPSGARLTPFALATQGDNSYLTLLNSEVKNSRQSCLLVHGNRFVIRGNHIHHCGTDTTYDHRLYWSGDDAVIAHNRFEHNACYNIQNYPHGAHNTYERNVFTASGCGVILSNGPGHVFRDNLLYDDASQMTRGEHGLLGFGTQVRIDGNILVNNGMVAINNDQGGLIRGNTLCHGTIQAVHAEVKDNRFTCEGIDVEKLARERGPGSSIPPVARRPAPTNLRVRTVP